MGDFCYLSKAKGDQVFDCGRRQESGTKSVVILAVIEGGKEDATNWNLSISDLFATSSKWLEDLSIDNG